VIAPDAIAFLLSFVEVFSGVGQLSSLASDVTILFTLYFAGLDEKIDAIRKDYLIALMVSFTAFVSVFMVQQSSIIGMKFAQGDFEPLNFKNINIFTKISNIALLTIIGMTIMVIIEILDAATKVCKLFGLIFGGTKGATKVENVFI
jgi:hypothetical protein